MRFKVLKQTDLGSNIKVGLLNIQRQTKFSVDLYSIYALLLPPLLVALSKRSCNVTESR